MDGKRKTPGIYGRLQRGMGTASFPKNKGTSISKFDKC
jgi:hypothetical protein